MNPEVNHMPANFSPDSAAPSPFVDRRSAQVPGAPANGERRQFGNSYANLTPEARELGVAVDQYKLRQRRRFVTYDELLAVVHSLGYRKA